MMSVPQQRLWEAIKVTPVKWHEPTYGIDGGGFWVVAIYGSTVVWYNDIEEGFNASSGKHQEQLMNIVAIKATCT